MAKGFLILLLAAAPFIGACDSSIQMAGSAGDGEVFNGTAIATGAVDTSGTVQLISNRGANCVGRFQYEGVMGPDGKMTFNCSDGRSGEATMHGLWNGVSHGTIAGKPFNMKWGRGA